MNVWSQPRVVWQETHHPTCAQGLASVLVPDSTSEVGTGLQDRCVAGPTFVAVSPIVSTLVTGAVGPYLLSTVSPPYHPLHDMMIPALRQQEQTNL